MTKLNFRFSVRRFFCDKKIVHKYNLEGWFLYIETYLLIRYKKMGNYQVNLF